MANTIRHKRSSVPAKVPSANDLAAGELAINTADVALYTKDASNVVVAINDWSNVQNKPDFDDLFASTDIINIDTENEDPGIPGTDDLPDGQWGVFYDEHTDGVFLAARRGSIVYKLVLPPAS